jgi:hypothetical protein
MFSRAKKMTQKTIVLHPEHKNRILSDSQLVPDYSERLMIQKWLLTQGIEIDTCALLYRGTRDGFQAK